MRHFVFELSMPNCGSWNGKWTGANHYYAVTRKLSNKSRLVPRKEYYRYNFGDGWAAKVTVREVSAKEATHARRKSQGFCGYEWMVDSILSYGEILDYKGRKEAAQAKLATA
jgi:hypothetical protein